ncbi:MAG TPA: UDP-N-acetylglucosamine 2-epimerase (non-hydrolyzing) [Elusimicrobia bacterium]|nr:UDP-N-acetylglucosamine 2-epimerase (non-hydrolyzing) [Elusimicrobiota bacterium]
MKVLHVVGARPNFMKAAPVLAALKRRGARQVLVHTGQHYDASLSDVQFRQLGLPRPDENLEVGSGSHAQQTALILGRLEPVVLARRPDWVVVYGDVNSTVAAALLCSKLGVKVAHVEAGLRSFDRSMPEEINRLLTDQVADLLFTPSVDADANLACEGVAASKIRRVGNVMIDTLVRLLPKARRPRIPGLAERCIPVTLHRPSNVDDPASLRRVVRALERIARRAQVVFPVHPRTRARMKAAGIKASGLLLTEPLGYLEFLYLQKHALAVITDSGGIQEETTFLGVPCLTVRRNTERPITLTLGTNVLVGEDMARLEKEAGRILDGRGRRGRVPPLWDGRASERIADALLRA